MSLTLDFYLARAAESATEADNATLDNVRERALRSEAAWREMAGRQARINTQREIAARQREDRPEEL